MKTKHFSMKSVISMLLAVILVAGTLPVSVFAAQKSDYEDPADNWLKTNNRTNELDMNATVTLSLIHISIITLKNIGNFVSAKPFVVISIDMKN